MRNPTPNPTSNPNPTPRCAGRTRPLAPRWRATSRERFAGTSRQGCNLLLAFPPLSLIINSLYSLGVRDLVALFCVLVFPDPFSSIRVRRRKKVLAGRACPCVVWACSEASPSVRSWPVPVWLPAVRVPRGPRRDAARGWRVTAVARAKPKMEIRAMIIL